MNSYRIVYPGGERTKLAVTYVHDYEENEYDIASSLTFHDEQNAIHHMLYLAEKHGLNCPKFPKLLD